MRPVSEYFVSQFSKIRDAVAIIDRGAAQIALVIKSGCLVGVLTDGDVRRGLLRGESLDSPVEKIMNPKFRFLTPNATEQEAMAMMQSQNLHQIPVIDEGGKVVRLFLIEELLKPQKLLNPVLIMAGGEGKRLRPLTQNCPKPMLKVGGKPILEIILKQCIDAGFEDFYFSVNYLKEQIKAHFQEGDEWGVRIQYLQEDKPLGTAGALSLIKDRPSVPLLVINGDVLSRLNFRNLLKFHSSENSTATLCVREHTTQIPYGVVHLDKLNVLGIEEKPMLNHYINSGIYLLNSEILELVPNETFLDMPELLAKAVHLGRKVSAFPIHEYWLDIGLPETLSLANGDWL